MNRFCALLATLCAVFMLETDVRADCAGGVSASASGNDIAYSGSGGGSCGGSSVTVYIDGISVGRKICETTATCEVSGTISAHCKASGNHTVSGYFECGHIEPTTNQCRPDTPHWAESTFAITEKPRVTMQDEGVDDGGTFHATITYYAPRSAFQEATSEFWVETPTGTVHSGPNALNSNEGTIAWSQYTSCWREGVYKATVRITACGGDYAEATMNMVVTRRPSVNVTIDTTNLAAPVAIVSWSFPPMDAGQRHVHLEWIPDGNVLWGRTGLPRTGQERVPLPACIPDVRDMLKAVAVACGDYDTGYAESETPASLPACEMSCAMPAEGRPVCPDCVGSPIRLTSGNMRLSDADPLPGLAIAPLRRTYDSIRTTGRFGRGWSSVFDAWLRVDGKTVLIGTESADRLVFLMDGSGYRQTWPVAQSAPGTLVFDTASACFLQRDPGSDVTRVFRDGRLVALRSLTRNIDVTITYDASGLPQRVEDSRGTWAWTIANNSSGISTITLEGRPDVQWTYTRDSSGNLTSVTSPLGPWRTYTYGTAGLLTARDATGSLIESHTYDSAKHAATSAGASDDLSAITYDLAGRVAGEVLTRVSYASGRTTDYYSRYIAGKMRTVQVDGSCNCGTEDTVYTYDPAGHIVREQNALGYVTTREFTSGRLTREVTDQRPSNCDPAVDAQRCRLDPDTLGAASLIAGPTSLQTTYAYFDPNWPDRVTAVMTPSVVATTRDRRQTRGYHATSGAVTNTSTLGWIAGEEGPSDVERATVTAFYGDALPGGSDGDRDPGGETPDPYAPAFDPGRTFQSAWLALPQPRLQKSVDGPRTDVNDVTLFVYYPVDTSVPALLRGNLAAVRNAAGHMTRYEAYDVFGNPTRVVDANGVITDITYDAIGRLVTTAVRGVPGCDTTSDPLCATDLTTTRTYAGAGSLQREERAGGGVTVSTYDDRGRLLTISRGPSATDLRERIENTYDPSTGHKTAERRLTFAQGAWVERYRDSYAYDPEGRLRIVTHADGTTVEYTYDAAGRITTARDENHASANTAYQYDPAGRLTTVSQTLADAPDGTITTGYEYDRLGNLTLVRDPNGNTTRYTYDDFGEMLQQQSPVTGVTTYSYDDGGELVTTSDANGATTTRSFDVLGRVTAAVSTRGTTSESVTWTYDSGTFGFGRLASMSDPTGVTTYQYERRGLLSSETRAIGGGTYAIHYQYDRDGNRSAMQYPSGRLATFTFDHAGRPLTASLDQMPLVTSTQYLPFGPATESVFGNGTTRRTVYDARYRPASNELTSPSGTVAAYAYHYDNAGNITAIDDAIEPSFNRAYVYDDLNRLTAADTGEALWGAGSFRYDAMGNVTSLALGETRASTFAYGGTTPRLLSVTENGRVRSVSYDAAGNEIAMGADASTYNPRNSLSSYAGLSNVYDGRGIRTITARAMSIAAFSTSPDFVAGGNSAQGTVTLSSPAPASGAEVVLTSASSVVTMPASVTVAPGQVSATFTITTQAVAEETHVVLSAAFNGSTRTTTLTVTGSRIDDVLVQPSSVVGGNDATGTISLSRPAPEEGLAIAIASSSEHAQVPPFIRVEGGQGEVAFPIHTSPVPAALEVTITASVDGEQGRNTTFVLLPPGIASIAFEPSALHGGSTTTGTVTLTGPAGDNGAPVVIQSNSPLLSMPDRVLIPAGARFATFTAIATAVESETAVIVNAVLGEGMQSATVRIEPPVLTGLTVNPALVVGGETATAVTTLDSPAADEGASVAITSSDTTIVPAPGRITVPAGETSEATSLATSPVAAATSVVVSAARNGVVRSTTVTVGPPPVTIASLAIDAQSIVGTNDAVGTVTLTDAAPANGIEVELASSDTNIATVPVAITIAAGARQATFAVATHLVSASSPVAITAAHATTEKSATLTVLPPAANYVASVAVTPAFIVGGTTATVAVTLAAPATGNGADVALSSSAASVLAVPATVHVLPNATSATASAVTSSVTTPEAATVTARYGDVVQKMNIVVARENAVTVGSLEITPDQVSGGNDTLATITLNRPAPYGGAAIAIEANRRNIVRVPASVTIPEGATSAAFTIETERVAGRRPREVDIAVTYNGTTVASRLTVTPTITASAVHDAVAQCASASLWPCLTRRALDVATTATTLYEQRYTFYSPELSLIAETASSTTSAPPIAYEYIWFAGQPLAQIDNTTSEISWYFNDHLGTPLLQTDNAGHIVWRAEYEPYGSVYAIRRGEARHQPLRFPGQTAEDGTDVYQNVFRWYRPWMGRYTQADPVRFTSAAYLYADANPLVMIDPRGLASVNFGPVQKHEVDVDEVHVQCASAGAGLKGCARLTHYKFDCSCHCTSDGFKRSISVHADAIDVFAATNAPTDEVFPAGLVPVGAIFAEEMKHVADFQNFATTIKDSLDLLEEAGYASKKACTKGCSAAEDWFLKLLIQHIKVVDASHPNYYAH